MGEDKSMFENINQDEDDRLFRVSDSSNYEYTAKIRIDYTINNGTFSSPDFVIINI
jgi:hypothetical protein